MTAPIAILAGGLGTRLGDLAGGRPKPAIDINGEPFLGHQLRLLARRGIRRAVVCVSYGAELLQSLIHDGRQYGIDVEYSDDGAVRLGTAGAIRKALPMLNDAFFVTYGDTYLDIDYEAVEHAFRASGQSALMVVFRNDGRWDTSNVKFVDGVVVEYDKWHPTAEMSYIDYGLGLFDKHVFEQLPPNQPVDLADVYYSLVAARALAGVEVTQRFYEIGSPEGLAEFRKLVADRGSQKR